MMIDLDSFAFPQAVEETDESPPDGDDGADPKAGAKAKSKAKAKAKGQSKAKAKAKAPRGKAAAQASADSPDQEGAAPTKRRPKAKSKSKLDKQEAQLEAGTPESLRQALGQNVAHEDDETPAKSKRPRYRQATERTADGGRIEVEVLCIHCRKSNETARQSSLAGFFGKAAAAAAAAAAAPTKKPGWPHPVVIEIDDAAPTTEGGTDAKSFPKKNEESSTLDETQSPCPNGANRSEKEKDQDQAQDNNEEITKPKSAEPGLDQVVQNEDSDVLPAVADPSSPSPSDTLNSAALVDASISVLAASEALPLVQVAPPIQPSGSQGPSVYSHGSAKEGEGSTSFLYCSRCLAPMHDARYGSIDPEKRGAGSGKQRASCPLASALKRYKQQAVTTSASWELTDTQALSIMREPCCLCKAEPDLIRGIPTGITRLRNNNGQRSMGPYSVGNTAPACATCNMIKGAHRLEHVRELCRHIATFRKLGDFGSFPDRFVNNTSKRSRSAYLADHKTHALTNAQFNKIVEQPCHYCGKEPQKGVHYNGLDRLDNSVRVYTESTCVSCCGTCNMAKGRHSEALFLSKCAEIARVAIELDGGEGLKPQDEGAREAVAMSPANSGASSL
mmetsp:Transcript_91017/g.199397  ORF Transcript_91017/g.199397 Transcript_91017/m.199397 type:complete len:617 (+) Transcript_91017:48-1898(+)